MLIKEAAGPLNLITDIPLLSSNTISREVEFL